MKPEEPIMFRPRKIGGMGVHSVKCKAKAGMIRNFMETAINPKFRRRLDHQAMFEYHVKGDRDIINPGFTPYYTEQFFNSIREVWEDQGSQVETMSEKQWYQAIYETSDMTTDTTGRKVLPHCRVEKMDPLADWEENWNKLIMRGLGPANTSLIREAFKTKNR